LPIGARRTPLQVRSPHSGRLRPTRGRRAPTCGCAWGFTQESRRSERTGTSG
jgi:hypothetical protein